MVPAAGTARAARVTPPVIRQSGPDDDAGAAALREIPADFRTGLTRTRAVDLYRSIPARHHTEPAAAEFKEVLAA